jgi:hypothetical protein
MDASSRQDLTARLDKICAGSGALLPVGLVVGNVAFEVIIALVGVSWMIRCAVSKSNSLKPLWGHPLFLPWMALYFTIVVSLLINGPGNKGWLHDIVFIRYIIFGLALIEISQRLDVSKYLVYGLIAGVIWAALNTLCAYIIGFDLLGKPLVRYTGKLKEAARIAAMTAYAAPFFVAWGLMDAGLSQKARNFTIMLGLLAFVQVLHAHIRTDVLASSAGIGFVLLVFIGRRKSWRLAFVSVAALVLCLIIFFLAGNQLNLLSFYDRIYYWKVAWAMWLEHPLCGVGISSFQDTYQAFASSGAVDKFVAPGGMVFERTVVYSAHNLVLMLLSSTGLLGMAAFTWLFANTIRMIAADTQQFRAGLMAWPIVLLGIGLTGCNIYDSWYQALFAFFIVLIGTHPKKENFVSESIL